MRPEGEANDYVRLLVDGDRMLPRINSGELQISKLLGDCTVRSPLEALLDVVRL